jgi:hypothetical protein
MNLRLALLSAILLTIPACRESISSDTADEGGQIADPLVNNALMNADKPTKVEQVTDLYVLLFKHSPSEGRSRLRKILERSPDKTKLAERLLTNYSGEKLDLAINALSMAMYKWPDEYAKAIMRTSRWPLNTGTGNHCSSFRARNQREREGTTCYVYGAGAGGYPRKDCGKHGYLKLQ